jgi:hypothetical protein
MPPSVQMRIEQATRRAVRLFLARARSSTAA